MTRSDLPVDSLLPEIVSLVAGHPVTLIEAEPGAGKTTRIPMALLNAGLGDVIALEPRRIAARMAAKRVAEELGEPLGKTIGYQVRFENQTSSQTRLRFVTEGILTQRLTHDKWLKGIQTVVLDEFHERHLETDLALALLRNLLTKRGDLRIVVMSATLNGEALAQQLGGAPLVRCVGRQFPVEVRYRPVTAAPLEQQVAAALESSLPETKRHTLIFLPGAAEIRQAMEAAAGVLRAARADAFALHGDLPADAQDRAVAPSAGRKVIFSTNVAESSITIDGVATVIDSGLARVSYWSPWSGLSALKVERISRSSAVQRVGRAGRTNAGLAIRLFPEEDFRRRPEQGVPEILRADLCGTLLQLASMGLACEELPWLEAPPPSHLEQARALLDRLRVSEPGPPLSALPLHPRLARFVLQAAAWGSSAEACRLAALLSEGRLRLLQHQTGGYASDIDALLDMELPPFTRRLEQQISRQLPRQAVRQADSKAIEKAMLLAFPDRVARKRGAVLLLAGGGSAQLDQASATRSEFLCAIEAEERSGQSALVRIASPIEPDWLLEFFPGRVQTRSALEWNRAAERVEQVSALTYDQLVIDESRQTPDRPEDAAALLASKAIEAGAEKFVDRQSLDRLLLRIHFARPYLPLAIPDDSDLVAAAISQLTYGLRSFSELRQAAANGGLEAVIESLLTPGALDDVAPTHVRLPGGRRARIEYAAGQPPWLASRLQDFFGMKETPRVGRGNIPLVVHLLAPNGRPVQVTEDLASFWRTLYPQMFRQLSRRYPKHRWPADPYQPE